MIDNPDSTDDSNDRSPYLPDGQPRTSWWIGRWAHVIAGLVFCLLYLPFDDRVWGWQVAITVSYVVFMVCCIGGLAFRNSAGFFGNHRVPEYLGKLLVRQVLVLAVVSLGAYLWRALIPTLPLWATHRGRRPSLWDFCGILVFYLVAVREASWMAAKIDRRFPELEGPISWNRD